MIKNGISVVVPNYNGAELLSEILPSLFNALQRTQLPFEVILSDDHSTDNALVIVAKEYPQVIILESPSNKGFSHTANNGIRRASYDLVFIMNNDLKLTGDYFGPLLKYFDRDDCFGVMGRIIGWDDDEIQDGGKFPFFHGVKIKTSGNYIPVGSASDKRLYSMYLSGANALVDRKKLLLLGGFDEIYSPFYIEDFDMGLRAWRLGWKCYYEHEVVCRHKTSVTIKKKSTKRYINTVYYRNKMILHAIHLDSFRRFLFDIQIIPELLIRLFSLRFYFLRSLWLYARSQSAIKESRLRLQTIADQLGRPLLTIGEVVQGIRQQLSDVSIDKF